MLESDSGSRSIMDFCITCVEPSCFITKRACLLVKIMTCFHLLNRGMGTHFFKHIEAIDKIVNIPHMIKNIRHMNTLKKYYEYLETKRENQVNDK